MRENDLDELGWQGPLPMGDSTTDNREQKGQRRQVACSGLLRYVGSRQDRHTLHPFVTEPGIIELVAIIRVVDQEEAELRRLSAVQLY
jgi:hypothetical protein